MIPTAYVLASRPHSPIRAGNPWEAVAFVYGALSTVYADATGGWTVYVEDQYVDNLAPCPIL